MTQTKEQALIQAMNGDQESIKILADYLDYKLGKNPVDPDGETRILFTNKGDSQGAAAIVVLPLDSLTTKSTTVEVRKLYEKVIDIKDHKLSVESANIPVIGFVGKQRLIFFKATGGNRDTRLDLNPETTDKDLYIRNFSYLKNDSVTVENSLFGYGQEAKVSDAAFRRELSSGFLTMVSMYRKKLSEWITASDLKNELYDLVDDKAKFYIKQRDINSLAQNESYKSVLSTVVDTISLRQLMRRFLEGYYGADSFNVSGIALGVGGGTLDEAIERAVTIARNMGEEKKIKKINREKAPIEQLDLFNLGFTDEELNATSRVEVKKGQDDYIADLSKKANDQFRLAYGGDLFAGSIGKVATKIDHELAKQNKIDWVKPYVDTKAGNYSFRFEDMPPEAIEKQYEDSMSQNVQITFNKEKNKPEVFFGDDEVEQKNKGAYYTDQRFVNYMVNQTVAPEFQRRFQTISKAVGTGKIEEIDRAIKHLLDLKIADFTCGGGSFLRGAFLKLADQFQLLNSLDYPEEIKNKYDFLNGSTDSQYQWEDYVLKHMIYGVDIDYKAVIIASLTLTLSTLQHKPKNTKLPQLIGRTLIHQNALIDAAPYYKRKEIFSKYQSEIARLRKLKTTNFDKFVKLRNKLTEKIIPEAGPVANYAESLKIGCIELALPEVYFNEDGSLNVHGGMDIVIGNPPWEIWMPLADEFFSEYDPEYRKLPNKKEKKKKERELQKSFNGIKQKWDEQKGKYAAGSKYFKKSSAFHYQSWVINGRKATSHLNLYKIALERFTQLANEDAQVSILVPDNFATDNGAAGVRHLVIDNYGIREFLSFDNGKGVFPAVHRSYKFAVLTFDKSSHSAKKFKVFFYHQDIDDLVHGERLDYPLSFVKRMDPESYALVETQSQAEFFIFQKLQKRVPLLRESQLIKFSSDLNRTSDSDAFENINDAGNSYLPVFEGKYMNQFEIYPRKIAYAVNPSYVENKIGKLYSNYRIAIRTIARSTDRRSLIATLLPKNCTSANSLSVQREPSQMTNETKLFILGVLNSYTLDFMLRQMISANVNQIYLRRLPVPKPDDFDDAEQIEKIVLELLQRNSDQYKELGMLFPNNEYTGQPYNSLIAELNARIMVDYHLARGEVMKIMDTFKSPNYLEAVADEEQRILNVYDKLIEGGQHERPVD